MMSAESSSDTVLFSSYGAGKRDKHDSTGSANKQASAERPKTVQVFQKGYYLEPIRGEAVRVPSWRMKEKMKTVSAALVVCLNIGVDPPDIVKTSQCSKLECWINPTQWGPQKALELIGAELFKQYERWQPRARYKQCLDPTTEEVKKLCVSLRKNAKDERVLFHYNGHGVPKPTVNGEIWVFNKEFTQYIPLSLIEVQTWMGTPSLYVWDCSNAGIIIQNFLQIEDDREQEYLARFGMAGDPNSAAAANGVAAASSATSSAGNSILTNLPRLRDSIHLGACGANEVLPMHPDLPLDLFTACLTTPIKAALNWYISQKNKCQLVPGLTLDLIDKIPGQINDRRTMMGELNWIFTAITDTIAWNVLDSELFQKLFRQDLLVASLFRNFLLAERIMKSLDVTSVSHPVTPVSHPALPPTHEHPLWQSWDLALDMCITQLSSVINNNNYSSLHHQQHHHVPHHVVPHRDFVSCGFFTEQIEIFDVWLRYNVNSHTPPEQLPVVLQILLSQQHRMKALELLGKFLDLGPWAVSAALSVGIFPYVLKLLTTQPRELRPLLTFIWAKILAVDKSCQTELVKDNGHVYFIQVLADSEVESTHKVYSAFVLSCLVDNYPTGQETAKQNHLIATCTFLITDKASRDFRNPLLRQWCCICLGLSWQNFPEARWEGVRNNAHLVLIELISDPVPEVRAAAMFALSTYIGCGKGTEATFEQTNKLDAEIVNAIIKDQDIVYMVRKELIMALYNYINQLIAQNANQPNGANSSENNNSSLLGPKALNKSQSTSSLGQVVSQSDILNGSGFGPSLNQNGYSNQSAFSGSYKSQNSTLTNGADADSSAMSPSSRLKPPASSKQIVSINVNQASSLLSNNKPTSLFIKVWNLIDELQNDPHPEVAELAQRVYAFFVDQAHNFDSVKRAHILETAESPLNKHRTGSSSSSSVQIGTEFVPWCCKYFLRPLLSPSSSSVSSLRQTDSNGMLKQTTDLYAVDYLDQECKILYNQMVKEKEPSEWREPQSMEETLHTKHNTIPIHCKFHPYDDQMFVVDKEGMISVYDTEPQIRSMLTNPASGGQAGQANGGMSLNNQQTSNQLRFSFPVCNPDKKTSGGQALSTKKMITSFKLMNVHHEPLLLTGDIGRVVRVIKPDLVNQKNHRLVTAFKAFADSEIKQSNLEVGFVTEWDEFHEVLICAGHATTIRVWDMTKELFKDYNTNVLSAVSSLSYQDNLVVAGFGDGTVKLFDFRKHHPLSMSFASGIGAGGLGTMSRSISQLSAGAFSFQSGTGSSSSPSTPILGPALGNTQTQIYQHNSIVSKVKIHKNSNKLLTASVSGDLNVFDFRTLQSVLKAPVANEGCTAAACHPINELVAIATQSQTIKVYNFGGKELACIKHHEGFLGKRISNVMCIDWNSYKNDLVFGAQDYTLSIFGVKD